MNQNILFTLCNAIFTTLSIAVLYPLFKTSTVIELHEALKIRPVLVKTVGNKNIRSHNQSCIFFSIALAAYVVIAIGNDVEVDIDLAITSLVILFAITFTKSWGLRKPLANW